MKKTIAISAAVLTAAAAVSFGQLNEAYKQAQQSVQAQQNPQDQQYQQRQQQRRQQIEQSRQEQDRLQGGAQNAGDSMDEQRHFLMHSASDNQYEIQAGQFVEQHAQNQQVKQLAQRLVQDHQRAQQQLQQIARQMNVNISQQLMPVQQAMWDELQKKHGQFLERSFTFEQVGDHEKDVLENQWVAEHAQSPQIKQFAQQQVPVLQEHLRLAMQAAEQFVPQAAQAGAQMRGTRDTGTNSSGSSHTSGGTSGGQNPNDTGRTSR